MDGKSVRFTYLGVIDYLQPWTCGKVCAMWIKVFERNKATIPPVPYGDRFLRHFARRIQGDAEEVVKNKGADVNGGGANDLVVLGDSPTISGFPPEACLRIDIIFWFRFSGFLELGVVLFSLLV